MDKREKNLYSHRGQALRKLRQAWPAFWTAVCQDAREGGITPKS